VSGLHLPDLADDWAATPTEGSGLPAAPKPPKVDPAQLVLPTVGAKS